MSIADIPITRHSPTFTSSILLETPSGLYKSSCPYMVLKEKNKRRLWDNFPAQSKISRISQQV